MLFFFWFLFEQVFFSLTTICGYFIGRTDDDDAAAAAAVELGVCRMQVSLNTFHQKFLAGQVKECHMMWGFLNTNDNFISGLTKNKNCWL